ncbi:MAG TPA: MFS transporter [Ilumatobacteraceae bacterium]
MVSTVDRLINNPRSIGRPFRLVWLSVWVSSTGDGMFVTAFPLLAATLTRDPVLIAGVTIASRLPWLFFSMVTGAIADRMDRRRLMVGADAVRFVMVGVLGVLIAIGDANIWLLYSCAFLLGTAETLHTNAGQAILPALVEAEQLMEANARYSSAQTAAAQFAGPALGSSLFGVAASIPFLADAVSFAGSAAFIGALPDVHQMPPPTTRLRDDVREGLSFIRHHAALRRIATVLALINFFYFAASSLLVLYAAQQLHSGKFVYTALFIAAATGTVLSRWIVTWLSRRFGVVVTLTISFWTWAITMAGLAITSTPAVAIALFVFLGVGNGLWLVLNTTLRQQLTPARLLGRMNAAYRTISWGVVPFGAAFGGLFAKAFGLRAPFIAAGVVLTLVSAFAAPLLRPIRDATPDAAPDIVDADDVR